MSQATPPKPSPDVCKAQRTADPPQDCDWPFCGCDPSADKVIEAIQESGFSIVKDEDLLRMSTATHSPDIHKLAADLRVKWTAWLNSFGVPISQQFAEFAEAVGKITDLERAGLADETAPAKEKP